MSDPWVVDVKGEAGAEAFEISVHRKSNKFARESYGWYDETKLLITHNGGPCRWPLTPLVWDMQVQVAHRVAAILNARERA